MNQIWQSWNGSWQESAGISTWCPSGNYQYSRPLIGISPTISCRCNPINVWEWTTRSKIPRRPKLLLKWLIPVGETYDMLVLISWTGSLGTDWHISQWTSWLTGLHWMRPETPSKSSCHASFHHHYVTVSILAQKHLTLFLMDWKSIVGG